MKLVIDANIAFSLLKKDSKTRRLANKYSLELFSHPFILEELEEHSKELCSNLNLPLDKFERIREILHGLVDLKQKVSPQLLHMARTLISDIDDTEYLALALKTKSSIWSNDSHFKEQNIVKVFSTEELAEFLESSMD